MKDEKVHPEPFICPICKSFGYYEYREGEDKFLVCQKCGYELAELNCPQCGCEWEYTEGINNRFSTWECGNCHSVNHIEEGFYNRPNKIKWEEVHKDNEKGLLIMLWERKLFYLAGFVLAYGIGLLNISLGTEISKVDLIALPLALSFILGHLIYLFIKEPERLKKEGRGLIFAKEGAINFTLTIVTAIISGILIRIFG